MLILDISEKIGKILIESKFTNISKIEISENSDIYVSVHGVTEFETREQIGKIIKKYFNLSYISFDKENKSLGYSHLAFCFENFDVIE